MELHHNSHEHLLIFVDGESETDELVPCSGCGNDICGARYSCFTCEFHLHKSCTELPLRLEDHPLHPHHPLTLLPRSPYAGGGRGGGGGGYSCDACEVLGDGFVYNCSLCNFDLHVMCAVSVYQKESICSERTGGKSVFRYGTHQHVLKLEEEQKDDDNCCFVCSESIFPPFFSCSKSPCRFRLHKSCADLLQILHDSSFHPQHPLVLISLVKGECQICGQKSSPPAYACKPCHFSIHPRCALSNPIDSIKRIGEKQIQHFTHQHLLTWLQDGAKLARRRTPYCNLCKKEAASFPRYGCKSCSFVLHKSCAELPPRIKSHLHLDHFLYLFARPPEGKAITDCDCCAAKITQLPMPSM